MWIHKVSFTYINFSVVSEGIDVTFQLALSVRQKQHYRHKYHMKVGVQCCHEFHDGLFDTFFFLFQHIIFSPGELWRETKVDFRCDSSSSSARGSYSLPACERPSGARSAARIKVNARES